MSEMEDLLTRIRACMVCAAHLPHGPRPVLRAGAQARIAIISQAPGARVHETGIPWNDASGDHLREWLALPLEVFNDPERIAIIPMGFCWPGRRKGGDLPPRPECAPLWHPPLLAAMPRLRLKVLIGQYALARYLPEAKKLSLTETVRRWREWGPDRLPLPHPSWRSRLWIEKNPWFVSELLPDLRARMAAALAEDPEEIPADQPASKLTGEPTPST